MNILVTGARAPISADIVRVLAGLGHRVWTADSMLVPIGRFAQKSSGHIWLPAPRKDFAAFAAKLVDICERLNIDRIIPTSEEVFWLAGVEGLPASCQGFFPSLDILGQLHNKHTFAELAQSIGYGADENHLFTSTAQLDAFARREDLTRYVLKPVYSRFASEVMISPIPELIGHIQPTEQAPWLAQTRVQGEEVCLYNVAVDGELILHTAYRPALRAGKGASVYFEPEVDDELLELSADFVAATRFTGQISFDVIRARQGIVALECNPRGTSGVHLAAQNPRQFGLALLGETAAGTKFHWPAMLGLPLLMYNPTVPFSRNGRIAWRRAEDAMKAAGVPLLGQALATMEVLARAVCSRQSILSTTTTDFEWNGEPMGAKA
jgi:hypothetical protein